jgi:hypothetical protein
MCREQNTLSGEYYNAKAMYLHALEELKRRIGVCSEADYQALQRMCELADARQRDARLQYEKHISEHKCTTIQEVLTSRSVISTEIVHIEA